MTTRYQEYPNQAAAQAAANAAFTAFRARRNVALGLNPTTSLDRQSGAVRTPAITSRAMVVLSLGGLFIVESPDDDNVNAGAVTTVDRASLSLAARTALDQRDAAIPVP